jgi:hypothetical protein
VRFGLVSSFSRPGGNAIRFELVLDMRTAKRPGLTVPPAFIASVDEVIE